MSGLRIAKFLPEPSLREVDRIAVAAAPEQAWKAARGMNLARIGFVRLLFEARVLPERLSAWLLKEPQPKLSSVGVEAIEQNEGPGFRVLDEAPGREVVAGAIGRFWKPHIEWADVEPKDFAAFADKGWGKVAWCIRVDPREAGGSWVAIEVRVGATDARSIEQFRPYWGLIGRFSRIIRRTALRRLARELGPAPRAKVAGAEIIAKARFQRTHHRMIEAPPKDVWPWLVQMGCRRAGWYSYDRLDNGGVRSADRVVDDLQQIKVGDFLPATPKDTGGFAVLHVEREKSLVLGSPNLLPGKPKDVKWAPYDSTWAFQLEPAGPAATNLVVQVRATYEPTLRNRALGLAVGFAHEVMQPEQLRNLKARIEKGAVA